MITELPILALLYGAVAAIYAILAASVLSRQEQSAAGRWFGLACCVTAGWGGVVAWSWHTPLSGAAGWLELMRSITWYGFIFHIYRRSLILPAQLAKSLAAAAGLTILLISALPAYEFATGQSNLSLWSAQIAIRLGFAVCGILLLENLYFSMPREARWHVSLLCVGLGSVFCYDLLLSADGLLYHRVSRGLVEGRGAATLIVAPLLAISVARYRRWNINIHVSRDLVFHSATLIVSGVFLLAVAAVGELFRRTDADWGEVVEVALVFASLVVIALLITSGSARSRLRSALVDPFFTHRYDYRREWLRCIDTLTAPQAHVGLHQRAIRALAEIVDSPAGALFVRPPQEVAFQWAGSWNMPAAVLPVPPGHPVIAAFGDGETTVTLGGSASIADCFEQPPPAWLAVPLKHLEALIGFVVLTQPRANFKLDQEVFQLLRVVGSEVASRLAEQRAAQILSQTEQLREYGQRFAFVIHDIKNVSGQLSMLLKNAELHADNPAFQRDMLATVRASVGRITRVLSRLQVERQERSHYLIIPARRLPDLVEAVRQTSAVTIQLDHDSSGDGVAIEPDAFDAVITHLLTNAAEASGGEPVQVQLRHETLNVVVDIIDQGSGMAPEFIRDKLFVPLATTKRGGHGIGAYQARELLRQAGGDLLVLSRPGAGTTMRLMLPRVAAAVTRHTADT